MNSSTFSVCDAQDLPLGSRKHFELDKRLVTVLNHKNKLYCIDTVCYHGGGPLGLGKIQEIEDLGSTPTIKCEWHSYCVSLEEGKRVYQSCIVKNGTLQPGSWVIGDPVQRTHKVDVRDGMIHVHMNRVGNFRSDDYDGHRNPETLANIRTMLEKHLFSCSRIEHT